ncbi:MAG: ATP-binding cassette domain-containing protein [Bacteroidetes bacterium]|nr:ATP-binding cassette domain-containing protein [Bacteroidota bacterium]
MMLKLEGISVKVGEFRIKDISLEISEGDYFMLLGPSGAGKSVLLEIIAGLTLPDKGKVFLQGKDITREKMRNRNISMIFQGNTIFPHMSVRKNLAYALASRNLTNKTRQDIIRTNAEKTGITHLLGRMPGTLSGGEIQRVIIARALGTQPNCLLLDEPLSSIDVQLKDNIIDLLREINKGGMTVIHVTHDYHEAFSLAHRMAIMDNGTILQHGTPEEIIRLPRSGFVARFMGLHNYYSAFSTGKGELILEEKLRLHIDHKTGPGEMKVLIPQPAIHIGYEDNTPNQKNCFSGKLQRIIRYPGQCELSVNIGISLIINITETHPLAGRLKEGDDIHVTLNAGQITFLGHR